jgi:hypothetical protein
MIIILDDLILYSIEINVNLLQKQSAFNLIWLAAISRNLEKMDQTI